MTLESGLRQLLFDGDQVQPTTYGLLLSALQGLAPDGSVPHDPNAQAAFWATIHALEDVHSGCPLWSGPAPMFEDLPLEADAALRWAADPRLTTLVEQVAGPILPLGDFEHAVVRGIDPPRAPHVRELGTVRATLVRRASPGSTLVIATRGGTGELGTAAGTLFVHPATTLMGARCRTKTDELVTLSCGFLSRHLEPRQPPFVATPKAVVERILDLASVTASDVLVDLGCGDGALLQGAARRGARAIGVEIDPLLVAAARQGAPHGVKVIEGDARQQPLPNATVITLFLNPEFNESLRPQLESAVNRGVRVVTHMWPIKGWTPASAEQIATAGERPTHRIYLYR
jgi:Methyltransferase domain